MVLLQPFHPSPASSSQNIQPVVEFEYHRVVYIVLYCKKGLQILQFVFALQADSGTLNILWARVISPISNHIKTHYRHLSKCEAWYQKRLFAFLPCILCHLLVPAWVSHMGWAEAKEMRLSCSDDTDLSHTALVFQTSKAAWIVGWWWHGMALKTWQSGNPPPTSPLCRPVVWGRPVAQGLEEICGREKPEHGISNLISVVIIATVSPPDGRVACVQTAHASVQDVSASGFQRRVRREYSYPALG